MRREWIEIFFFAVTVGIKCLPPCGGSGLKSACILPLLAAASLPPCGGSGLKYADLIGEENAKAVSLHAEGVD